MSSLLEYSSQTKSTLSSLTTLLEEHERTMRSLDREMSEQNLDAGDQDSIYRVRVCTEKRSLLEQSKQQILNCMTQSEIILLAMARISQLEVSNSALENQMKLVLTEAQNLREQLEDTRERLEQSQERVVELEEEHEQVKFLASLNSRAESAITGSLEGVDGTQGQSGAGGSRGEEGGEDKSAYMHMDDSTESSATEITITGSEGGLPVPEVSEDAKRQMAIIVDYGKKGNYDIAVNLSKKALEDQTGTSVQARTDRAVFLNTLALLYRDMEKPGQSIPLLEEALSIREELHGSAHMGVAAIANNLAIFYSKTRQYKRAADSCEKALRVKEEALGAESVEVAKQLSNLALICVSRKKFDEAEFHFARARDIYQTALGPKDRSVLKTMTELGQCYSQQGKLEEAEALFKQVVGRGEELQREGQIQGQGAELIWMGTLPIIVQCGKNLKELYLSRRDTEQIKRIEALLLRLNKENKRNSYIPRLPTTNTSTLPRRIPVPSRNSPTPGPARNSPTPGPPRNSPTPGPAHNSPTPSPTLNPTSLPSLLRSNSKGAPVLNRLLGRGQKRSDEGAAPTRMDASSK